MMWNNSDVTAGMFVTSTKGERIGKVVRGDTQTFVVEKGMFFPKDYELRYDHIVEIRDNEITYSLSDFLEREARMKAVAGAAAAPASAARRATASATASATTTGLAERDRLSQTATAATTERERARERLSTRKDGVRIALMTEEIDVEKVSRETGHVRVHKAVKTEERRFTVPVTREEVVIEHVAADKGAAPALRDATFQEETVDVTLHEEELRVSKHPVLREEIVIRTMASSVEKEGSATLRYEEAEIEDTRKDTAKDTTTTPGARIDSMDPDTKR